MANSTLHQTVNLIEYISNGFWEKHGNFGVNFLPLMDGSPLNILAITSAYLYGVKVAGPAYMKNKNPMDLRSIMFIYNILLITINICLIFAGLWFSNFGEKIFECRSFHYDAASFDDRCLYMVAYLYFLSKFVDYLDTGFFILRKKYSHVTFLHVFHHAITPIEVYIGIKFYPHSHAIMLPMFNAFVHIIMYSYYAIASLGPQMQKYLWWKRYMTQIQLAQFVITFFHGLYFTLHPTCTWPKIIGAIYSTALFVFFCLFAGFYVQNYRTKREESKKLN